MFAYSDSTITRKSNDDNTKVNFCSRNSPHSNNRPESYYNSCSIVNLVSRLSDIEQKRMVQKRAEEAENRKKLLKEQERRYKLCAEQERLVRERTSHQLLLKQEQSRDALRKFYERKAKEAKFQCPFSNNSRSSSPLSSTNNSFASFNSSSTSSSGGSITSSSSSSRACPSSNNNSRQNSCRNLRQLVEKSKAALKINGFIIHHVRRRRTRRVLNELYILREIENRLTTEQQKDNVIKLLEQLNSVQCNDSEIVCARKNVVSKVAKEMLAKKMAAEDDFVLVEFKGCDL
ncbi:10219_t:CDS:1 [Acaulospora morrowiae]|uniref:10219_t:CDS:1 n=1 Tax=Acaulospora morrowiae TaxID=94023 RepID=A0A9N9F7I7_9GLOM|nr:10219_t:CDS:1 [Acaulospora morrowiae]